MAKLGFLKETKKEMQNVQWPTRRRTVIYTVIILVLSLALGYALSGVDTALRAILRSVI